MFKKLLFYALVAGLSFICFSSKEFGNFAQDSDFIKTLFNIKDDYAAGQMLPVPKSAPECYVYFKNTAYDSAAACFKKELIDDRNNPEIHYYLAYSYYGNKNYSSALFHTNYIIKNLSNSSYLTRTVSLQNKIETDIKEKQKLETSDKPDYFDEMENPLRWGNMPVTVWIEDSSNNFNLRNAFYTWQNELYPTIAFRMVNRQEEANIVVTFEDPSKYCKPGKTGNAIGCTSTRVYSNDKTRLYDAKIRLGRYFPSGKKLSDNDIYGLLCHEIGHAIGIDGHSKNRSDIMYPTSDHYNTRPTLRDVRTVRRIYGK